jgi:hypothetical protein
MEVAMSPGAEAYFNVLVLFFSLLAAGAVITDTAVGLGRFPAAPPLLVRSFARRNGKKPGRVTVIGDLAVLLVLQSWFVMVEIPWSSYGLPARLIWVPFPIIELAYAAYLMRRVSPRGGGLE